MILFSHLLVLLLYSAVPVTSQSRYNETEARVLLDLSAGAYSESPGNCVNRSLNPEEGWLLYSELNAICDRVKSLCSGYIVRSDKLKQAIIVFRGTRTKEQLFAEGWQGIQPGVDFYGLGKINRYFRSALETLWPFIEPMLTDPVSSNYTVTITGHSLGGALASLTAAKIVSSGLRTSEQVRLVTFGQPRVGDRDFAFNFDQLVSYSYRVVHRLDVVPHLPACKKDKKDIETRRTDSKKCDPTVVGQAYHHGTEIWYPYGMKENAEYFECRGNPRNEDFDCSDSLNFEFEKYDTYINDHRHYFDHKVPSYGKLGCVENFETVESVTVGLLENAEEAVTQQSVLKKMANKIKNISRFLGLRN